MTRQRNKIYAQGNALIRKFYMCTENVKIALFKSYCTTLYTSTLWCKYRRESLRKLCVAYKNIFRKLTHQARDCSASQMFVSRQLPTCKMLIRRNVYGFMLNVQKSNNLILNSIVHCDILFTSPLWKHWRLLFTHVLVGNHIQTPHCGVFVLYNFILIIFMDVIYPQ